MAIAVDETYRGKGIGEALLGAIEDWQNNASVVVFVLYQLLTE